MLRSRKRWLAASLAIAAAAAIGGAASALAADSTGTISGTLTDSGAPVTNASVELRSTTGGFVSSVSTDAAGMYTFTTLAPGAYVVQYFLPGGLQQFAHGKRTFETADQFTVTAGATTTVDESVLPHGALSGHVTNDNGTPAAGASVQAENPADPSVFLFTNADANGLYQLPFVPAGDYIVSFQPASGGPTQFANNKTSFNAADLIHVATGATTTLDQTLLPTGTITGTLTDAGGNPVANANVSLANDNLQTFGFTDANGAYSVTAFPGTYRLEFDTPFGSQWAHGETSAGQADPIVVTGDQTTTVNETLNPTGSITVTATDNITNAPIQSFCVFVAGLLNDVCTTNGTAQFASVLPGRYGLSLSTSGNPSLFASAHGVVVTGGQDTAVHITVIEPATVTTKIVDATTGAPVANACLHLVDVTVPSTLGNSPTCSGPDGLVTAFQAPGTYTAFVDIRDGVHGDQWVTAHGGVGAFVKADQVTLASGSTTALPTIMLDKTGSISGTITDAATGQPVPTTSFVSLSSLNGVNGGGGLAAGVDSQGHYTLENLGPYKWTLFIASPGHEAAQFSGGVANRDDATGVQVRAGATTTFNAALTTGSTLTGTVAGPDGTLTSQSRIVVFNALTGDEMYDADGGGSPPGYTAHLLGPQKVKLFYTGIVHGVFYAGFVGGTDLASATVFRIPQHGTLTVNITMTQLAN
jgi:hypothetical protein